MPNADDVAIIPTKSTIRIKCCAVTNDDRIVIVPDKTNVKHIDDLRPMNFNMENVKTDAGISAIIVVIYVKYYIRGEENSVSQSF